MTENEIIAQRSRRDNAASAKVMNRNIIVTGGAGYIGSHVVKALQEAHYVPIVLDNFSSGHRESLPIGVEWHEDSLSNIDKIKYILNYHKPQAVIHLAASIDAGLSMSAPREFYENNVRNSLHLFDAMIDVGINNLIFSSSAAVYGQHKKTIELELNESHYSIYHLPIEEDFKKHPMSTYGRTKLIVENILECYDRAYQFRSISLRYFNACGADASGTIGEAHNEKTHLIELALLAVLGIKLPIRIFGNDYPTPDGTAIRDYVHVSDIAQAHILALEALLSGAKTNAYNVGIGKGYSVKEVLDIVNEVTGKENLRYLELRRPGDPAVLIADNTKICKELNFHPKYIELKSMIETAWQWHKNHPNDYNTL